MGTIAARDAQQVCTLLSARWPFTCLRQRRPVIFGAELRRGRGLQRLSKASGNFHRALRADRPLDRDIEAVAQAIADGRLFCNAYEDTNAMTREHHASFEIEHKVAFYELDPMQIVWHGNYYKYFEDARSALLRRQA